MRERGAADGTSNPPIQRMIANLRALGHSVDVDDEGLRTYSLSHLPSMN